MNAHYGLHNQFTAQPGQADALTEILLAAAEGLAGNDACLLYLVSRSPNDAHVIWVTEVWTSEAAHDESLQIDEARAAVQRAIPLVAGIAGTVLRPVGGKGI